MSSDNYAIIYKLTNGTYRLCDRSASCDYLPFPTREPISGEIPPDFNWGDPYVYEGTVFKTEKEAEDSIKDEYYEYGTVSIDLSTQEDVLVQFELWLSAQIHRIGDPQIRAWMEERYL